MGHDASLVVMGTTRSSIREVINRRGLVDAGLAVRIGTAGIGTSLAVGAIAGISLGRDLSDAGHTAIEVRGNECPIQLTAAFTPVIGSQVFIDNATGRAKGSATDATGVNAQYRSGVLSGRPEAGGTNIAVALIDFPGGL